MSDYKDIIRKPETLNWFKAAMGMNITRDCLLDIVKKATHEFYQNIRKGIKRKRGISENVVCSQCHTPNVLPCPNNKLCNTICQEIVEKHRFRNLSKPQSFQGPTWVNTDACKWCTDPWQIAKCYLSKDGYKDVNQVEDTDFNGIVNLIFNCEFFQMYFKDDLTQKENICTKARDVGRDVRHAPSMSMTSQDSDGAIDTLVALVQSLKHVDHQAASKAAVDKLTQLKNGTLAITSEDVAATFEHLKENLIAQIKEAIEKERDKLVKEMVDALNENLTKALETIQRKGEDVLETVQIKGADVLETVQLKRDDVLETVQRKGDDVLQTVQRKEDDVLETVQRKGEDVLETIQTKEDDVLEAVQKTGDDVLETVQRKEQDVLETVQSKGDHMFETVERKGQDVLEKVQRKGDNVLETIRRKEEEVLNIKDNPTRNSKLSEIQAWLIEQYRAMCVVPVSMLDPDIDAPLERIYVPPSIKELKRGHNTSRGITDLSSYKELLNRDGNQVNTIYIQGNPGCGKTTFSTKLVLDWCKAHSENGASTKKENARSATASEETLTLIDFTDLDTLRDYTFLFFVSLRDYSGSICNVSQMVEDAIKSNKLAWDDSFWEHKCIVLTDAADEWYHPEISFPLPIDSACKCRNDRSMPLYLQRPNITNIITSRPWKLANRSMSDTLTRLFEISGVTNYQILAENVINVLAEKDGISQKDQQSKCIDILNKLKEKNMGLLITIPAICVQLVHQFYVGRLMEGSLCAIYINMLDMHIAKGLRKLNIEQFDTDDVGFEEITNLYGTASTEYLRGNGSLVRSASALAFKTLTDSSRESSLVFLENKITNHMTKTNLDYLLQTGIITKRKSLSLWSQKNIPYMFVHKTFQEFLASLYIAMNHTDIQEILNAIQLVYGDGESILDICQLFVFTCGMCAPSAERMSKHMMDVITRDMESQLHPSLDQRQVYNFKSQAAQKCILDGFIEGAANKQPCLQLTLSHVLLADFVFRRYKDSLNTLINMNISNIISIDAMLRDSSYREQVSYRVQEVISQSRKTVSYMWLNNLGLFDLQGLKLKYLKCGKNSDVINLDCTCMHACEISFQTPLSEKRILQSMSVSGKIIRKLEIYGVKSIDLLCVALPNLTSLHTLILHDTKLAETQLYCLPESIRRVVYFGASFSAQDIKSVAEFSNSRNAGVGFEIRYCGAWLDGDMALYEAAGLL